VKALVCRGASKVFYEAKPTPSNQARSWWDPRRLIPKKRPIWAVRDVSFTVGTGEIFGILGPNGSGKSTLIRLIATLLLPDEGELRVFGHNVVKERMAVRRLINRVSVEAAFFKKLSAWENLHYASRLYGLNPRWAYEHSRHILQVFGFEEENLHSPVENLSRGMQQKISITRALLTSPKLMLLDEPTTGLDPRSKAEVQKFVSQLHRAEQSTILLTSHDLQEVELLCDRVAIMNQGRVVALDTVPGLKRRYTPHPEQATLEDVFFAVTGTDWEEALADD